VLGTGRDIALRLMKIDILLKCAEEKCGFNVEVVDVVAVLDSTSCKSSNCTPLHNRSKNFIEVYSIFLFEAPGDKACLQARRTAMETKFGSIHPFSTDRFLIRRKKNEAPSLIFVYGGHLIVHGFDPS
jgi:hypothetical protein